MDDYDLERAWVQQTSPNKSTRGHPVLFWIFKEQHCPWSYETYWNQISPSEGTNSTRKHFGNKGTDQGKHSGPSNQTVRWWCVLATYDWVSCSYSFWYRVILWSRGITVTYTTLLLEISFSRTKACPVFWTSLFIFRFVTSAQLASSSVFGLTFQKRVHSSLRGVSRTNSSAFTIVHSFIYPCMLSTYFWVPFSVNGAGFVVDVVWATDTNRYSKVMSGDMALAES